MEERLLHYVWQHRLWLPLKLVTEGGEDVDVLDTGMLNHDSGPDFFNAKVRIGARVWAGNVEIHVRASDWYRHGHDSDPAYDSVVLHVVACSDGVVRRSDGNILPQVRIECNPALQQRYNAFLSSPWGELACGAELGAVPAVYVSDWITALAMERLQSKAARITALADAEGGDWQHAVYVTLARTLGFGKNNDAFERLALSIPLRRLRRHADNLVSVEAMLLGQAGFLENTDPGDTYAARLVMEYRFMKNKFSLEQPRSLGWKSGRMRPSNFPLRRVATLAAFVCSGFSAAGRLLATDTVEQARANFDISLTGYWAHRCQFGAETVSSPRAFSRSSLDVLVINVLIPVIYAYGLFYGNEEMMARAVSLLQQMPPEDNSVTRLFRAAGLGLPDAFTSQALVQLRRNYCETRKCLYCRFGHRLLAAKAR